MILEILGKIIIYETKGTGWYFKEVISLEIHIVDYKPMRGSSFIPLPEFIKRKNAINNIKNEDDKCFLCSVLRYLHPKQCHEERVADLRVYENDLNLKGINFPVKVKDIQKFENQNPDLPGINVFSVNDNNKIYPLRINQKDRQKTIDPFLFSEDKKLFKIGEITNYFKYNKKTSYLQKMSHSFYQTGSLRKTLVLLYQE